MCTILRGVGGTAVSPPAWQQEVGHWQPDSRLLKHALAQFAGLLWRPVFLWAPILHPMAVLFVPDDLYEQEDIWRICHLLELIPAFVTG